MGSASNDLRRLTIIVERCDAVLDYVTELGINKESYLNPSSKEEEIRKLGIDALVMQILEEIAGLTDETRERMPGIDWQGAAHVRNLFAHVYAEIDDELVWNIIESDLRDIEEKCAGCMRSIESGEYAPRFLTRDAEKRHASD